MRELFQELKRRNLFRGPLSTRVARGVTQVNRDRRNGQRAEAARGPLRDYPPLGSLISTGSWRLIVVSSTATP